MKFLTQWLLVFLTVLNPIFSSAALTDFDRQELPVKNWLAPYNSGFESSKAKWTASGGTFAAVTSGTNLLVGKGSATWDGSSASQTLTSQTITIEKGYYGQNCEAGIVAQVPSGTATHTVQAYDGTNILVSATIVSSTTPRLNTVNFPCPQSGTVALRLVTVASDEPLIAVDDAYLGLARNVGSTQLITEWVSYTPTFNGSPATSSVSCFYRRNGDSLEVKGTFKITTTNANDAAFTLPSGLAIDTSKVSATRKEVFGEGTKILTSGSFTQLVKVVIGYNTTYANQLVISYASSSDVLGQVGWDSVFANNDQFSFSATVPIVGWTAQTTASIDAISKRGSIYFASGSATNTGSVAAFNVAGFGTNTLEGQALAPTTANDLGIRMTGAPAGTYEVQATGRFYVSSAATTGTRTVCNYSLYDGTSTRGDVYALAPGGLTAESNDGIGSLTGQFVLSSAGTINVVVRGQRVTGNGTCYAEGPASISIKNVSQNSPAIVLANSVSSSSTNGTHFNSSQVGSTGTVSKETGDWISGSCSVASAVYTCTLIAGAFSTDPACHATIFGETTSYNAVVTSASTSSVVVRTFDTANAAAAAAFALTCSSPR